MYRNPMQPAASPGRAVAEQPRGPWARWIAFSTPRGDPDDASLPLSDRERLRRARLASSIIAVLFVLDLFLIPATVDQASSLAAVVGVAFVCALAAILNKLGRVTIAGYILVLVLVAAVVSVFLGAPNGVAGLDYFPVYDLLTIPLLVAASVLPRVQIFLIALLNTVFILVDARYQPHGGISLFSPDGLSLVLRPVILQVLLAIVSYLWARSMDRALTRADRAEELAALEHQIAEQKRQLDSGVQQILQTHIRAANGDFSARAPLGQDNVLWQISSSLNNLLARLQRAGNAEFRLQRTEEELARLTAALRDAQAGRRPIWPVPSGTAVDQVIEVITGGQRRALPPDPTYGGPQPAQYSSGPLPYGGGQQQQSPYGPGQVPYTGPVNSNPNF